MVVALDSANSSRQPRAHVVFVGMLGAAEAEGQTIAPIAVHLTPDQDTTVIALGEAEGTGVESGGSDPSERARRDVACQPRVSAHFVRRTGRAVLGVCPKRARTDALRHVSVPALVRHFSARFGHIPRAAAPPGVEAGTGSACVPGFYALLRS